MSAVKDLRDELIRLLGDLLGQYTYPDNTTTPAINVGHEVPEGVKVEGLEAVIAPEPGVDPMPMQGDQAVKREWTVILRQWDDRDENTLREAVERAVARWPTMVSPIVIPATYETKAQARLSIPQRVLRKGV